MSLSYSEEEISLSWEIISEKKVLARVLFLELTILYSTVAGFTWDSAWHTLSAQYTRVEEITQKVLSSVLTCRIHNGKALPHPHLPQWHAQR